MPRMIPAAIATASVLTAALAFGVEPIPDSAAPRTQVYYYQQPAPAPVQQVAPVQQQPQQYYSVQPQPAQRPTVFGRMMELERRKNQAILRFFGLR